MVVEEIYSRLVERLSWKVIDFLDAIAALLVVFIFLIIGYLVSRILVHSEKTLLEYFKTENWLKKKGLDDALFGFHLTSVLAVFIELITVAVFLAIAADVVQLSFLNTLVNWFIGYVPSLIEGAVIIMLALYGIDYVTDKIKESKQMPFSRLITGFIQVFFAYTAIVIALPLVLPGADVEILKFAFLIVIAAAGVAIGLGLAIAVGLGAKDTVGKVIEKRKKDLDRII